MKKCGSFSISNITNARNLIMSETQLDVNTKKKSKQWSTVLPNTARPGIHGDIRRYIDPMMHPELGVRGCRTLYEGFRRGYAVNPLGPCMGFRAMSANGFLTPFVYSSYTECLDRVNAFAAGLHSLKLVQRNDDGLLLLAIYMKNCMEWVLAEQGIFCLGGATVPLYDTLGPDTTKFILAETGCNAVVTSRSQLSNLCHAKMSSECSRLRYVIVIDGVTPEAAKLGKDSNLEVMPFAKVEAIGAQLIATSSYRTTQQSHHNPDYNNRRASTSDAATAFHNPPAGNDLATFCYTSGTTGNPKGAMLTHQNLISAMGGVPEELKPQPTDRHLSYLPLAHIMERIVMSHMFFYGASVAFYRGDPKYLQEDLVACKPSGLIAAPRVLNKIYDTILSKVEVAGGAKKRIFDTAVAVKTSNLVNHNKLKHPLYDLLLFNRIKKALGMDHVRGLISGSAPLNENVMKFFRIMLGVPVLEGYGQTEGSGVASVALFEDTDSFGHVGGPAPCAEIMLADVPEMGYYSTDTKHGDGDNVMQCQGRGEICIRGPNVFIGYYKNPQKTAEIMDSEGWLHSGDIGLWTVNGTLKIIDRKKNIFKLSQGEYIAPEKIENILINSLYISQCFVYGDSLQSSLVAICVLDEDAISNWYNTTILGKKLIQNNMKPSLKELCNHPELIQTIEVDIQRISKQNGLHGFEIPKAILLESEQFTPENGLTTPTFKVKRQQARDYYQRQIDEMYAKINAVGPRSKL